MVYINRFNHMYFLHYKQIKIMTAELNIKIHLYKPIET